MSGSFKQGKMTIIGLLVLGMVLGGLFVSNLNFVSDARNTSFVPTVNADNPQTLKDFSDSFANVSEQVKPSVVLIRSKKLVSQSEERDSSIDDFFGPLFRAPRQQQQQPQRGLGSGVVVSKDGYILTFTYKQVYPVKVINNVL